MAVSTEAELQQLYVQLLRAYKIVELIGSPMKILDALLVQRIESVCKNWVRLEKEIRSFRMASRQSKAMFNILTKTSYTELRRVEAALKNANRDTSGTNDYFKEALFILENSFEGIALELKAAGGKSVAFLDVIPASSSDHHIEGEKDGKQSAGQSEHDPDSCPTKALQRRLFYSVVGSQRREQLEEFLAMPGITEADVWIDRGSTALHDAVTSMDQEWVVHFITTIMKFFEETEGLPWTAHEFLNEQTEGTGCTALHFAVGQAVFPAAKCLIDHGASIFIRDCDGNTPLDYMYTEMPELFLYILTQHAVDSIGHLTDKELEIILDFGVLVEPYCPAICMSHENDVKNDEGLNPEGAGRGDYVGVVTEEMTEFTRGYKASEEEDETLKNKIEPEMNRLASIIYGDSKNTIAPKILSHIVVKLFVELKWNQLKWPIYGLTLFYIAVYLGYTAIVSYIFIMKFPYSDARSGNMESEPKNDSMTGHLLPDSGALLAEGQDAFGTHPAVAILFAFAMVIYMGLEIWQYILIKSLTTTTAGSAWSALGSYVRDLENVLQLLFLVGASAVLGALCMGGEARAPSWTYWTSAFTVVISWILILLQLGNFYGLGKYVHMLQTVFTSFATVMALYLCFLVGFNIAFAIIFPQVQVFSFPRLFFRSFAMMSGELNFDEVFNPEESRPFELASLTIYLGFVIIVTIVVGNLLIGLTVGDVAKIFKDADLIHRTIQVERLYIMEQLLWSIRIPKDMFLLLPGRARMDAPTYCTEISTFSEELQQELRCLLTNEEKYEKEYLQFEK